MIPAFVRSHAPEFVKAAGTTDAYVLTSNVPAGNLLVMQLVHDNAATASKPLVTSISKPAGETASWVFLGRALSTSTSAGAFGVGEMWAIKTTVAWPNGTSLTVTYDTSITMKAQNILEFTGAEAVLRSTVGTAYSTTTTAATATTTGTAPVIGDLALGLLWGSNVAAAQAGDTDTTAGAWSTPIGVGSTAGNATTNNFGIGQYKILTAASHQTYNNSAAMTAGNGVVVAILRFTPEPVLNQAAFRFYANGTESGATALAAQDTAPSVDVSAGDAALGLRVRVQETGTGPVQAGDDFQLQWERNASGSWQNVSTVGPITLDDTASITSATIQFGNLVSTGLGQSFISDGGKLTSAEFYLAKLGVPSGTIVANLYAHSGTFLGDGIPLGEALATSTPRPASGFMSVSNQWESFVFDGTYELVPGTAYVIAVECSTSDANNCMLLGYDSGGSSHPGRRKIKDASTSVWTSASGTSDIAFRVYTTGPLAVVGAYDSLNLTEGAATTNRLTGGTGSFVAGKVSEDGLVDDLGWPVAGHTELLFSLKLIAADLANGDTLRFRVLRNGAVLNTYSQVPTLTVSAVTGPVTYPASGTVAISSASSGNATIVPRVPQSASGVISIVSTVAGSATRGQPVNGVVSIASTAAGSVTARLRASGVIPIVSASSGAITAQHIVLDIWIDDFQQYYDFEEIITGTVNDTTPVVAWAHSPTKVVLSDTDSVFDARLNPNWQYQARHGWYSGWVRLLSGGENLGGFALVDDDNRSVFYSFLIDARNGTGSTAGFQSRHNTDPLSAVGVIPSQPIALDTWYFIELTPVWDEVDPHIQEARLYDASRTLLATVRATTVAPLAWTVPALVSFGQVAFDDVSYIEASRTRVVSGASGDATVVPGVPPAGNVYLIGPAMVETFENGTSPFTVPMVGSIADTTEVVPWAKQGTTVLGSADSSPGFVVRAAPQVFTRSSNFAWTETSYLRAWVRTGPVGAHHHEIGIVLIDADNPSVYYSALIDSANDGGVGTDDALQFRIGLDLEMGRSGIPVSAETWYLIEFRFFDATTLYVGLEPEDGSDNTSLYYTIPPITHYQMGLISNGVGFWDVVETSPSSSGATPNTVISRASGAATVVRAPLPASGTVAISSDTSGAVTAKHIVSGNVPISTGTTGAVTARLPVAGATAIISNTTGAATMRGAAAGVLAIVSTAAGDATRTLLTLPASGTVAIVSAGTGTVLSRLATSGTTPIVSDTVGVVTAVHVASGVVSVLSTGTGNATPVGTVSGAVDIVSVATGAVTSRVGVAGVADVVSASLGTVTAQHPVSGTVAITSATSGAATMRGAAAGTVPILTTLAGDATRVLLTLPASGTVALVSAASGAATMRGVAAGVTPVLTAVSGAATMRGAAAGTVPIVTDASGVAAVQLATSGSTAIVSAGSGAVTARHEATGAVLVVTTLAGAPSPTGSSTGVVPIVSLAIGAVTSRVNVAPPPLPIVSDTTGAVTAQHPVSGVVAIVVGTSGAATMQGAAAGVAPIVSTVAGAVIAVHQASGAMPIVSAASGALLSAGGQGTIPILSTASGAVTATQSVSGTVAIVSAVSAPNLAVGASAAGVTAIVSDVVGAITARLPLAGITAILSDALGTVTARHAASGVTPIVVTASGAITPAGSTAGTLAIVSVTQGAVTARLGVSGVVAVTSDSTGVVTARHPVSGAVAIVSTAEGDTRIGMAVQGVTVITSTATGSLGAAGVQGVVAIQSASSGNISRQTMAEGTVEVISAVLGVVAAQISVSGQIAITSQLSGVLIALYSAVSLKIAGQIVELTRQTLRLKYGGAEVEVGLSIKDGDGEVILWPAPGVGEWSP